MQRNGIPPEAQEQIIHSITSFALYGFPESHAASFALIAYASAWLKCHYLAAFTAALLNNQPMGFYSPATIVKDAQRHGLRVKPVDITCSDWLCTLEADGSATVWDSQTLSTGAKAPDPIQAVDASLKARSTTVAVDAGPSASSGQALKARSSTRFALRMGFRYARGLREETARAILRERDRRPFASIADLACRVPELRRHELVLLASIGALNSIGGGEEDPLSRLDLTRTHHTNHAAGKIEVPQGLKPGSSTTGYGTAKGRALSKQISGESGKKQHLHRRDTLWQVERAARFAGPLLESIPEYDEASPLAQMTPEERLVADFHGTGLTVGPHPMAYRRADLRRAGVLSAQELTQVAHGRYVRTAGCIIARQRPGTAKGFVFLSLEDETGIGNAIIAPDILERNRLVILSEKFLLLEGELQNQEGVVSVRVERVAPMREAYAADTVDVTDADVRSHDFH
jgi:error-prone DNA polymerase